MSSERVSHKLYRTHRTAFLAYAGRLTGDKQSAEDLVQDAWVLFEQRDGRDITSPVSYFKTIIRNLFQFSRRRTRLEKTEGTDFENASVCVADQAPSPEQVANVRWQMNRLLDVIDNMPPRQSTAIKMYYFEGLKLREIAAQLDLSVSYTQSLIAEGIEICSIIRETET